VETQKPADQGGIDDDTIAVRISVPNAASDHGSRPGETKGLAAQQLFQRSELRFSRTI
jgi:hypothetical protein